MGIVIQEPSMYKASPFGNHTILHDMELDTTGDATGGVVSLAPKLVDGVKGHQYCKLISFNFKTNDLSLANTLGNRQLYPYIVLSSKYWSGLIGYQSTLDFPVILEETVSNYLEIPYNHRHLGLNLGKHLGRVLQRFQLYFPSNVNGKHYELTIQFITSSKDID